MAAVIVGMTNRASLKIHKPVECRSLIYDVTNWFKFDNIVEIIDEHKTIRIFTKQKK